MPIALVTRYRHDWDIYRVEVDSVEVLCEFFNDPENERFVFPYGAHIKDEGNGSYIDVELDNDQTSPAPRIEIPEAETETEADPGRYEVTTLSDHGSSSHLWAVASYRAGRALPFAYTPFETEGEALAYKRRQEERKQQGEQP